MVSTRSLLLFTIASLTSLASAKTTITYPEGGEVFPVGQPVTIKWESDASDASVGLSVCWNGADNCTEITQGRANTGSFTWTPKDTLAPRSDYIIFMAIGRTSTSSEEYVTSPKFEVIPASSSTSGPSATSSGGASNTGGAVTTTGSLLTGTPVPAGDSNSNGTIIGAAVGAVGGVVIIAVVGFIWMRKRNQKKLAEARRSMGQDDVEAAEKKKPNGSGSVNGAAVIASDKKKPSGEESFAPSSDKKHNYAGPSNDYAMAELPAVQQEVFEMAAVPAAGASASGSGGAHFFAMELDSREIPRPGTSTVKPDADPTSKPSTPAAAKPPTDKGEGRGVSIDGTTVNSETERPTSLGSIEQIKESSREGSQRDLTQQNEPAPRSGTPAHNTPTHNTPSEANNEAGPSNRDSTPQIGSIPKLGGFDFDTAKF